MDGNPKVLCGACKCPVETVASPEPHDKVTCPRCNRSDRFDDVMEVVAQHFEHFTQKTIADALGKSSRLQRDKKFLKVSVNQPPNREFRWVMADLR